MNVPKKPNPLPSGITDDPTITQGPISSPFGALPTADITAFDELDDPEKTEIGPPPDPLLGKLIAGRFVIQGLLGSGGMGKVYLGEQVGLDRPVAIKMLHSFLANDQERKKRFQREAQAMTRFSHPGAVAVYDFGEWQGQLFLAMELLKGTSLDKVLRAEYPLPDARIVEIVGQACDTLISAHKAGIVHRDLKPENLMLLKGREGQDIVKIVDFGLAVLSDMSPEQRMTVEGVTMGTPFYMSPEQAKGSLQIDHRADIYALGVILYEMLCNSTPFVGDHVMAVLMQQMFAEPQPPSFRRPEIPINRFLEALSLQAMSKAPEARPQTVEEFLKELRNAVTSGGSSEEIRNFLKTADRDARASAVGLQTSGTPLPSPRPAAAVAASEWVIAIEAPPKDISTSIIASLSANGIAGTRVSTIADAPHALKPGLPTLIVVDLRETLLAGLSAISLARASFPSLQGLPLLVVGPDDNFDLMTKALEAGMAEYIPSSSAVTKLPKSIRRLAKRNARKTS